MKSNKKQISWHVLFVPEVQGQNDLIQRGSPRSTGNAFTILPTVKDVEPVTLLISRFISTENYQLSRTIHVFSKRVPVFNMGKQKRISI